MCMYIIYAVILCPAAVKKRDRKTVVKIFVDIYNTAVPPRSRRQLCDLQNRQFSVYL